GPAMPEPSLEDLLARRSRLHLEIANLGDLRRGSVHVVYRKCGNPGCRCAQPGEQGHGPQLLWTRSLDGRTKTSVLDPGRLEQLQQECANYRHLRGLVHELVEVSELICEARPPGGAQRWGLYESLAEDLWQERRQELVGLLRDCHTGEGGDQGM